MPSPTQTQGLKQEDEAERELIAAGYRIVERNWRGGGGEIDRIAEDGEVLVFVEIRSRKNGEHGMPGETVGRTKQGRVVRAAIAYLAARSGAMPDVRFDVVSLICAEVSGDPSEIEIVRGAFDASTLYSGRTGPML